jgi:hypothetical protein
MKLMVNKMINCKNIRTKNEMKNELRIKFYELLNNNSLDDKSNSEKLNTSKDYSIRLLSAGFRNGEYENLSSIGVWFKLNVDEFYKDSGVVENLDDCIIRNLYVQFNEDFLYFSELLEKGYLVDYFERREKAFMMSTRYSGGNTRDFSIAFHTVAKGMTEIQELSNKGMNEQGVLTVFNKDYILSETLRTKGFTYNIFSEPRGYFKTGSFLALYNAKIFDRKNVWSDIEKELGKEYVYSFKNILATKSR